MLEEIFSFIDEAIKSKRQFNSRQWFENDQIKLYIRYTPQRYINGLTISTIDIASVSTNPDVQGQGIFTHYLSSIEYKYPTIPIFVESILNKKFKKWLIKRGYQPIFVGEMDSNCAILQRN